MQAIVDSHVHLDADAFESDRAAVVRRAVVAAVTNLIVPATDAASWLRIRKLHGSDPRIHPAYGLHPLFLSEHARAHVETLSSWLASNFAVAVGEIGLDFHASNVPHDLQREIFTRQLDLAREHALPVIVHARGAFEEVIQTLRRTDGLRGVVHSFSGSEQQAANLWEKGFFLGIGGPVTYERARRLRRIVATMPLSSLLLESDAPDQPDAHHRGERNEPAYVREVLRCVASLREESEDDIAAVTTANAQRLFGLRATSP